MERHGRPQLIEVSHLLVGVAIFHVPDVLLVLRCLSGGAELGYSRLDVGCLEHGITEPLVRERMPISETKRALFVMPDCDGIYPRELRWCRVNNPRA